MPEKRSLDLTGHCQNDSRMTDAEAELQVVEEPQGNDGDFSRSLAVKGRNLYKKSGKW